MKKACTTINDFLLYLRKSRIDAYSAQVAFFTILSLIPLLILFISITQNIPSIKDVYIKIINDYIPENIIPFLNDIIQDAYERSTAAVSISAVFAAWTAARSIQTLTNGLNAVYNSESYKPWFILRGRATIGTILYILFLSCMMFVTLFGDSVQSFISKYIPLGESIFDNFIDSRFTIGIIFVFLTCWIFFKYLPDHKVTFKSQLPGAVLAAIGILALTYGLAIYVNRFNGFSMYGSITSIVFIMIWFYFVIYIMLFCAGINHYFFQSFGQKKKR